MSPELLSFAAVLGPAFFVIGSVYVLGPALPLDRVWARSVVFAVVWLFVARYMSWRLFTTVLPVSGGTLQIAWVWLIFLLESFALCDALILYVTFLRTSDRRAEADSHEKRLRGMEAAMLPKVDVLIATYNEPVEVLEKTIAGCLSIDYPNFSVWVLDDGRRAWLKQFCQSKRVGYVTRPDNAHAKAGNINHAIRHTSGDFIAVFDADFVPQRNFLMRTVGFFDDPAIGIVQIPHCFYNHDPMQANLALRKSLPDDQRFFFESIMPSRDAWNAAFCCGSNSVTRRSAMREAGGGLPTGSITEDMLLSLVLLRRGYITRYLCEPLAYGLAPESINAFFIQRQRWARGATQMLFLRDGPLGPGLSMIHRLLFLPTHWLTQSVLALLLILTPVVFLWTGLQPFVNVTIESGLSYAVPMALAMIGGITVFGRQKYFPLAASVLGLFQSVKILPTVVATLVKPHGHLFKVTPKGAAAAQSGCMWGTFLTASTMLALTMGGLMINSSGDFRLIRDAPLLPFVAFWCSVNIIQLFLVCMMCFQTPIMRGEERFEFEEGVVLRDRRGGAAMARSLDMSMSGAAFHVDNAAQAGMAIDMPLDIRLHEVGSIRARIARIHGDTIGVKFQLPPSVQRDLLVRKLFTAGIPSKTVNTSVWAGTLSLLKRIWTVNSPRQSVPVAFAPEPPEPKLPSQTLIIGPTHDNAEFLRAIAEAAA